MVSPKQDRVKARTVEDLERKHNFRQMSGNASDSLRSATEAREAASEAKTAASQAEASVANKVGKDDHDEIVRMLNASNEKVVLLANRLVVDSTNFSIDENGDVTMKSANKKGYAYSVTVDDGILTVDSPADIQGEGSQQVIELMRFHLQGKLYRLCLLVVFVMNDQYPEGEWVLVNQFIEPVVEEEQE